MISINYLFEEKKIIEPRSPAWTQGSIQAPIGGFGYPNVIQPNPAPATQVGPQQKQKEQDNINYKQILLTQRAIKNPNAVIQSANKNPYNNINNGG